MADETCGYPVGIRPDWMGVDQWDQCYCLLPKGHDGECKCLHTIGGDVAVANG